MVVGRYIVQYHYLRALPYAHFGNGAGAIVGRYALSVWWGQKETETGPGMGF